ncbi:MAG TPA: glycosyl hydrolase, partial [Blastocatellia bacterium]|nr:glycosyl hydrolase [Blastocatellia bacterium]
MSMLRNVARFTGVGLTLAWAIAALILVVGSQINARAQDAYLKGEHGLQWRQIGPFRGGRALAVTGVIGQPNTYYFGAVSGGVWKTIDGGQNWEPLFDKQPIQAIGAIAVAASDPNIIYVGTGEACIRGNITHGDGVYKSTDAGKTWSNIGLRDTRHIGRVIVDPHNPEHVFVAALGHAYGP